MSETETKNTNGNKQRNKIPRTTQVKRLHKANTLQPLKVWARVANTPLTQAWLAAKK